MCSLLSLCRVISPNPGHQRNPDKASLKRDPCQQTMSEPMPNMSFTQCHQGGNQGDLQMYEMSLSKEQRGKKSGFKFFRRYDCQSYLEVGIVCVRFCQVCMRCAVLCKQRKAPLLLLGFVHIASSPSVFQSEQPCSLLSLCL